jgi:hypothetical protein
MREKINNQEKGGGRRSVGHLNGALCLLLLMCWLLLFSAKWGSCCSPPFFFDPVNNCNERVQARTEGNAIKCLRRNRCHQTDASSLFLNKMTKSDGFCYDQTSATRFHHRRRHRDPFSRPSRGTDSSQ